MKAICCLLLGVLLVALMQVSVTKADDEVIFTNTTFVGTFSRLLEDGAQTYGIRAICINNPCIHYMMLERQLPTLNSATPEFLRTDSATVGQIATLFITGEDEALDDTVGTLYYGVRALAPDGSLATDDTRLLLTEDFTEDNGMSAVAVVFIVLGAIALGCCALLCCALCCGLLLIPLLLAAFKRGDSSERTKGASTVTREKTIGKERRISTRA